ncbi:MAG TPA: hypothetical protein VK870_13565 [Ignavibacteriaceae bacterium]|nr:hypothetical protein [Ignavibacteriaceae bacterium]
MKIFKLLIFSFLLFTFYFLLTSCSGSSCVKDEAIIPPDILEKGDQFIISLTGEDFFYNYISPDLTKSNQIHSGYLLAYKFSMPEKPFVNGSIRFTVDSLGNVLRDTEISGIPNCIESPKECEFIVDEEKAVKIAEDNNLDAGIKKWNTNFIWSSVYKKYIWQILNTLRESVGEFGYRGNGKEMIIDPNTGEVLALNDWRIN